MQFPVYLVSVCMCVCDITILFFSHMTPIMKLILALIAGLLPPPVYRKFTHKVDSVLCGERHTCLCCLYSVACQVEH